MRRGKAACDSAKSTPGGLEGVSQHGAPTGDVVEGYTNRVLHELRHARSRARPDERVDAVQLIGVAGDGDLLRRHTIRDTTGGQSDTSAARPAISASLRTGEAVCRAVNHRPIHAGRRRRMRELDAAASNREP